MNSRSIIFILILVFGNMLFTLGMSYYYGTAVIESFTFFTSSATTMYVIYLDTLEKKRPLLRVIPSLTSGIASGQIGMCLKITNIGDAVAFDINGEGRLEGGQVVALKNNGKIRSPDLAPMESNSYYIIDSAEIRSVLSNQSYYVKISYKREGNKDMVPIDAKGSMNDLFDEFKASIVRKR